MDCKHLRSERRGDRGETNEETELAKYHSAEGRRGSTALAGDLNAHSQRWDPICTEPKDARYWEDIIDERGLVIGNADKPTHFCTRHDIKG